LRSRSSVFAPASCSFSTAMICSSVNLARFICPSFVRSDSNSFWRKFSGAGHRRNGLTASSVMGMLLFEVRLATPHLKTGRPVALSSWLCRQPSVLPRERFRCVLGMFSSLVVKVH
jgi:hypothetical protein